MKSNRDLLSFLLVVLLSALAAQSQQTVPSTSGEAAVPQLVRFSGSLKDAGGGKPLSGVAGVTFALYKEDQGGAALWIETQNVQLDSNGRYSVMLGATKADGLPTDLFASTESRWLGVQPEGQEEQPRVLLVSVPYAMKAADAETIGGLPASAFMRVPQPGSKASESQTLANAPQAAGAVGGTGKINFLPIWTGSGTLGSSTLLEKSGKVGIGTSAPATTLDVNGAATIRGNTTITGTLSASSSLTAPSGALSGRNTSQILNVTQAGAGKGLYASTSSPANTSVALYGAANASTGNTHGVVGLSSSNTGIGVEGGAGGFGSGTSTGVYGFSLSSAGTGVAGVGSTGVSGSGAIGGLFRATGSSGIILRGLNPSGINVFSVDQHGNLSTAGSLVGGGAFVSGNSLGTMIGDPGCGSGTAAIGFGRAGFSPCSNYAVRGDAGGNLYINSSSTGWMFFDHNNSGSMSLDPSANLSVQGNIHSSGSGNTFGISTDSNAQQARGAGGWVKAMAYVDPFVSGGIAITRCYNSQMTGAAATTPPCGMSVTHFGQGDNVIDFGFEVNDRFVSVTTSGSSATVGQCIPSTFNGSFLTANQQDIFTYVSYNQSNACDVPFYVFVY